MIKKKHPLDTQIIQLLQQQGLIKSEANARLKQEVYQLKSEEISKIHNYANHFSMKAKSTMIEEILEVRREAMISSISNCSEV
ncbi:hypothetical protein AB4254_18465 [Vibrio breoganii]